MLSGELGGARKDDAQRFIGGAGVFSRNNGGPSIGYRQLFCQSATGGASDTIALAALGLFLEFAANAVAL